MQMIEVITNKGKLRRTTSSKPHKGSPNVPYTPFQNHRTFIFPGSVKKSSDILKAVCRQYKMIIIFKSRIRKLEKSKIETFWMVNF